MIESAFFECTATSIAVPGQAQATCKLPFDNIVKTV